MEGIGANSPGAIQNPGCRSGRLESFPVWGAFDMPVPGSTRNAVYSSADLGVDTEKFGYLRTCHCEGVSG